jgi:hypothetical protein
VINLYKEKTANKITQIMVSYLQYKNIVTPSAVDEEEVFKGLGVSVLA